MGSINQPFYRIVVLDSRKKRDGAYLESLGHYDPKTEPLTLKVDTDRALYWLGVGAQPSDTVRSLLRRAGIMQMWHESKFGQKKEEPVARKSKKAKTAKVAETIEETEPEITEEQKEQPTE
jgi:small subunit ribosomal protein S16